MNKINYEELDSITFNISSEEVDIRIDKFLANKLPSLSRSYIQDLIKEN